MPPKRVVRKVVAVKKDEIEKNEKKAYPVEDLANNNNKGFVYLEEVNQRKTMRVF